MPRTKLQQIVRFVNAPKGLAALPHGINLDGVPQKPDVCIAITDGSISYDVTATEVIVNNLGADPVDVDVWLMLNHTIPRQIGADGTTGMVPRPFLVIARPGGGSGPGTDTQEFTYIATGLEGSDFFIPLPAPRVDANYNPDVRGGGVANILGIDAPDLVPGVDRTVNQFHVITSGAVTAGDRFDVTVTQRT